MITLRDVARFYFVLVLFFGVVTVARGQGYGYGGPRIQRHDHSQMTELDRYYASWNRPTMRGADGTRLHSCCNNADCQATSIIRRNGKFYAVGHKMHPNMEVELPPNLF